MAKMRDIDATLVGIEAQEVSHQLAVASVGENRLGKRVVYLHGDLRDSEDILAQHARKGGVGSPSEDNKGLFDLVTGSPPYIPPEGCVVSPVPQRAHCRVELRGSVYDYCACAAKHLLPIVGRFVFVMLAQDPRTEDAPLRAGLTVTLAL